MKQQSKSDCSIQYPPPSFKRTMLSCHRLVTFAICAWCELWVCATLSWAVTPTADDITLQSMCRHGLIDSAIAWTTAEQKRSSQNAEEHARWTMRRMESEAQAALRSLTDAERHWQNVGQVLANFETTAPPRRLPWLKWQAARALLLHSQAELAGWLSAPAATDKKDKALELVRELLDQTAKLEDEIKKLQPLAARQSPRDTTYASAEQLAELSIDVVLLRCEALLVRSKCYDSDSSDRTAAATEVNAQATAVLPRIADEISARDNIQLAIAASGLELGRAEESLQQLALIARSSPYLQTRARAATIAIEYLASESQVSAAQPFLELLRGLEPSPELALAEIRLQLVELSKRPEAKKDAELAKLITEVKNIGANYGDYWRNRAESLLVGSGAATTNSSTMLDLLYVEVRQLLAAGKSQEAIDKLLKTSRDEAASLHGDVAIKLASQAAALLQRDQAWLAMADNLEPLSIKFPDALGSDEAHLLATWSISQALKAKSTDSELKTRYEKLLAAHITTWPDSQSAQTADQWYKSWCTATGRASDLASVRRLRAIGARAPEVIEQAWMDWLSITLTFDDAKLSEEIEAGEKSLNEQETKSLFAQTAILAARSIPTWLNEADAQNLSGQARSLLNSELIRNASGSNQLITSLLILNAIRNNKADEAAQLTSTWQPSILPTSVLGPWLVSFVEAVDEIPNRGALSSHLELPEERWQELLQSDDPLVKAVAIRLHSKNQTETASQLRQLIKLYPRSGELQLQLARSLSSETLIRDPAQLSEPIKLAKQVAAGAPSGSDLFFSARFLLCQLQMAIGKQDEARKSAQLILATHQFASSRWRSRFEMLAK